MKSGGAGETGLAGESPVALRAPSVSPASDKELALEARGNREL